MSDTQTADTLCRRALQIAREVFAEVDTDVLGDPERDWVNSAVECGQALLRELDRLRAKEHTQRWRRVEDEVPTGYDDLMLLCDESDIIEFTPFPSNGCIMSVHGT